MKHTLAIVVIAALVMWINYWGGYEWIAGYLSGFTRFGD